MSIKRYDMNGPDGEWEYSEYPDGKWVLYDDHAAEVERLRAALDAPKASKTPAMVTEMEGDSMEITLADLKKEDIKFLLKKYPGGLYTHEDIQEAMTMAWEYGVFAGIHLDVEEEDETV